LALLLLSTRLTALAFTDVAHPLALRPERALGIAASALFHLLLLAALIFLWRTQSVILPPLKSIDVQVLSDATFRKLTAPPGASPQPAPQTSIAVPPLATPAPTPKEQGPPADTGLSGMTHATKLFATTLLKEPASREVRATLPTLDRYERITQLCNIESTEQIRRAIKGSNPDTVSASAFADTTLATLTMTARGAAYRSRRNWYALTFTCTVLPDLSGVADYSFRNGDPIPKDQWEDHNLNAEDTDE